MYEYSTKYTNKNRINYSHSYIRTDSYFVVLGFNVLFVQTPKAYPIFIKPQGKFSGWAVSVFRNMDFNDALPGSFFLYFIFAPEKHYHVRILFNRTRFAQIRELRYLVRP